MLVLMWQEAISLPSNFLTIFGGGEILVTRRKIALWHIYLVLFPWLLDQIPSHVTSWELACGFPNPSSDMTLPCVKSSSNWAHLWGGITQWSDWVRTEWPVFDSREGQNYSLHHHVQTRARAHTHARAENNPATYSVFRTRNCQACVSRESRRCTFRLIMLHDIN
jgi:hypothetical protein